MKQKIIRVDGDIFNLADIVSVWLDKTMDKTVILLRIHCRNGFSIRMKGDHRQEIWDLMKKANLDMTSENISIERR